MSTRPARLNVKPWRQAAEPAAKAADARPSEWVILANGLVAAVLFAMAPHRSDSAGGTAATVAGVR
jgi:hypothetical protein